MNDGRKDALITALVWLITFSIIPIGLGFILRNYIQIESLSYWTILMSLYILIAGLKFYKIGLRDFNARKWNAEKLKLIDIERKQKNEEQWQRDKIEEKERQNSEAKLRKEREEQMKKVNFIFDLTPREFENEIAAIYSKMGYDVKITTFTNDKGVDVIAIKEKVKFAIQCKRLQKDKVISRPELQKLYGGMASVKARRGIFVATCKFSVPALEFARNNRIECIDLEQLVEIINKIY